MGQTANQIIDGGQMIALIRGKGPRGRQRFGSGDELPRPYENMRVEIHADHKQGGYKKYCVVAHKDDVQTMLRHCAAQVQIRRI
jgi:hypothetical protein